MGKIALLLVIVLDLLLFPVIITEHLSKVTKIVLLTFMIYYPLYPLTYFHVRWIEKKMKTIKGE